MNGDLSRVTFDRLNHYTRVVIQQGRVQLDADFNEQTAILLHYLQTLAADIIGPYGGPEREVGFEIIIPNEAARKDFSFLEPSESGLSKDEKQNLNAELDKFNMVIKKGRYYVDGRLCEIERTTPFLTQKDFIFPKDFNLGNDEGAHLVYLDVWERHITFLDDPNIHEPALGKADTAARAKLVWQVKIRPGAVDPDEVSTCDALTPEKWETLIHAVNPDVGPLSRIEPKNRGKLKAKAMEEPEPDSEPCITSPKARFRGLENQLYRVEIHKSGLAEEATFKWSRDNGTIIGAYKRKLGDELIVVGIRDNTRWFVAGDWVELTHDALELRNEPGTMVQLASVDGESLRIIPATADGDLFDPKQVTNAKVRRWNQKETDPDSPTLSGGAIRITESDDESSGWLKLEDGIRIQFQPGSGELAPYYRTGDYWLLPARVATGDIEWPRDRGEPLAVPPHGINHHYAPLALVTITNGKPDPGETVDLRHKFSLDNVCVTTT
jgi:hypothetical protein